MVSGRAVIVGTIGGGLIALTAFNAVNGYPSAQHQAAPTNTDSSTACEWVNPASVDYYEKHGQPDPEGLKPANIQVADILKSYYCYDKEYDTSTLKQESFNSIPRKDALARPGQNELSFTFTILSKDGTKKALIGGYGQTVGQANGAYANEVYPTAVSTNEAYTGILKIVTVPKVG